MAHDARDPQVSFDDEPLILVDEDGDVLGHETKVVCHEGEGILHLAFSVFLFDDQGRLLLQQRSAEKPLWPLFWSNSCCSHPRRGEEVHEAAVRRVAEELGLASGLEYLFRFQYHARFEDKGSERELCSVFLGRVSAPDVKTNAREIAAWEWIEVGELERRMAEDPESFTPWLKMEWARMREEFRDRVSAYTNP